MLHLSAKIWLIADRHTRLQQLAHSEGRLPSYTDCRVLARLPHSQSITQDPLVAFTLVLLHVLLSNAAYACTGHARYSHVI